jgi:peptidoglycan/LPS O-acetylase OafA/YrhL
MSTVNPPAWSLEVEIQFYCLAPVIAWTYFKVQPAWLRRLLGLAFIVGAGLVQSALFPSEPANRFTLSILYYIQYFFAGFLLCDLYLTEWDRIPFHWSWDLLSTLAWAWIFVAAGRQVHVLLPLAILIAYVGAFKGHFYRSLFRTPWVSILGGMCYSIYLTHNLAITSTSYVLHLWLASSHTPDWIKTLVSYLATIPFVLAFGLALYIAVERPCMDKNWPTKLRMRLGWAKLT